MAFPQRDNERHTYGDYLTWPDDVRYELLDGIAYLMAPAPSVDHQTIAFEVGRQLGNALENHSCRGLLSLVDVLLPKSKESNEEVDTVVQPDVILVCDPAKLRPQGVRGAPDWIMEVISPSSASHDQIIKLAAYEHAGVREYWLAHPVDRILTIYRHDGQTFGRPTIHELAGETALSVLPEIAIRWDPIVERLLESPNA